MNDDMHGPNHIDTGCPNCDQQGSQPIDTGPRLATVKLAARGENFRIVQLRGWARSPGPRLLMEVDPSTARHTLEHAGRVIAFCVPSCKKQFLVDPSAYLTA
jgi:YHS domain-containing protein